MAGGNVARCLEWTVPTLTRAQSAGLAEREGVEPSRGSSPLLAFQASAFSHSATSPDSTQNGCELPLGACVANS
jgi:hypothetical protein